MAKQRKPVPRLMIVLFYVALLVLIAFAGCCVFQTELFLFPYG